MQKPTIPKGMRDFGPIEMARRNYIFNTIKDVYAIYGFSQIETPTMENMNTLMGKYGEEGDRLLFRVLNSGDFFKGVSDEELIGRNTVLFSNKACEKGLRYDLTVPFARYVVNHFNELSMPFRRYQIQPVWRADRPQKGRYREFYQCDADIIGSDSLINEVELIQIIDDVFCRLGINVKIHLNNRKILAGMAEVAGEQDRIVDITVAIDKLEKIGLENVKKELREKGFSENTIQTLEPLITLDGNNNEKLDRLCTLLQNSEIGQKGIEETRYILNRLDVVNIKNEILVDLSLARGLSYYTGAILEVKAKDVAMGSITGGGRYDNLTGIFGMQGLSGVGISFGADRIYDVMQELNLFPEEQLKNTQLMFVNFGEDETKFLLPVIAQIRKAGIRTELYPEPAKMKKQMAHADSLNIPFVALVGSEELEHKKINIKNMKTGEQNLLSVEEVITLIGI
ncbi:Histidine--tRNA ligase [Porphyromonas macacae]|uniref:Histidine--tRNA ligase n=1 Tax=Porphyromonas macacae TaxID=28115 RepID=A0A379E925_9PORP|nr:histidine--tRNA ligase [Porphyromonas macacae]SUB89049.1 Histidine--tRNA ligase [Porphyromonas macacae]